MNNEKIASELVKLAKELMADEGELVDVKFLVNRDKIYVYCSSTSFVNQKRRKFSDEDVSDAIDKLKEIKSIARKKGIRLKNYTKRMSELKALGTEYNSKAKMYNRLFDKLYMEWKKIEKKKDLFYIPLSVLGDRIPEYDKATEIRYSMEKLFYRSEVLSKVIEINYHLDGLLRDINRSDNITMIAV